MTNNELLLAIIVVLMGAIGWFIKEILDNTKVIARDVGDIKPKVDILWKDRLAPAASPRQLNERGQKILAESGIKELIDKKEDRLLELATKAKPANPYDAEQTILQIVKELPEHCPDIVDDLKRGAYKAGENVPTVLFVGGMYLRDKILPKMGFKIEDM